MTAIAFDVLREARVDIGLIEVGLGGRLDATNVCDPVATAIVSIDLDHQALLGDTPAAIAAEKAGIARAGVPLVVGDLGDEALEAVTRVAGASGAPLVYAAEGVECVVRGVGDGHLTILLDTATRTYGPVRLALLEALDDAGFHVDRAAVETGLSAARWPGRLDRVALGGGRTVLLDAAHNASGARALAAHLAQASRGAPPPLVFAASKDKDAEAMIRALASSVGDIVVTAFAGGRGEPAEILADRVRATLGEPGTGARRIDVAPSPAAALEIAWSRSPHIVVAGSIFLLGEVYPLIGRPDPFGTGGAESRGAAG
jgi:dihydrofolate synthase/folylpolyglutamate synthase